MISPKNVDAMTEEDVKSLLKRIVADVKAGIRQESSADVGDMVIKRLEKAEAGLLKIMGAPGPGRGARKKPVLKETRR